MLIAATLGSSFSCWKLPLLPGALGAKQKNSPPFPPDSSLEMGGSGDRQIWFKSWPGLAYSASRYPMAPVEMGWSLWHWVGVRTGGSLWGGVKAWHILGAE